MNQDTLYFEKLVERALDKLPQEFLDLLDNVAVLVEDWPDRETHLAYGGTLYGLYEGVPLTSRGTGYHGALPDRITIFRSPLERDFPTEELEEQVRVTVVHEIAHHFGFDDGQLDELGWG
ncbi:metallopeptidase family protein [soil metagenome]|jgi:predicted Zn-dependent protease with MMP-like domain